MKPETEINATLYVLGALTESETIDFERTMKRDEPLRALVADLSDALAEHHTATELPAIRPPQGLKNTIIESIDFESSSLISAFQLENDEGFVVTGPDLKIRWVNPAFSRMCGYTLHELKNKKPGHVLQGPLTDEAAVQRLRAAIKANASCREELVNYHKDGTPYWVSLSLSPVFDEHQQLRSYISIEREISDRSKELEYA